jgi:hypothetical protein
MGQDPFRKTLSTTVRRVYSTCKVREERAYFLPEIGK